MTSSSASEITQLPIDRLQPNNWNPNQMSEAEFQELIKEVERLGRIPKPIVVRPQGDNYQIIDGEHNWGAAREVGLGEVPCEVVEVDDFEAMLQTHKRNQHGTHSPVREGQMFRRMLEERQLSQRQLAEALGVSEGTIRNRLSYAQAAAMRNRYADENRDAEIDELKVRQVSTYLGMIQPLRDLWLDAGGRVELLGKYQVGHRHVGLLMQKYGLTEFLDIRDFRESFGRLAELAEWLEQHEDVPEAVEFIKLIADLKMPSLVAWIIPVQLEANPRTIAIEYESWFGILQEVNAFISEDENVAMEVAAGVYERLEDLEVEPRRVYDGPLIAQIEVLLETPLYIRDATWLTLEERMQVHFATAPAPPDIVNQAKQETIRTISQERQGAEIGSCRSQPEYVLGVFLSKVRSLVDKQRHPIKPRCTSREALLRSFDGVVDWCPQLRDVSVAGRPAMDIFRDRLAELKTPELVAMRALFDGAIPSLALGEWMDAVHEEFASQDQPSRGTAE